MQVKHFGNPDNDWRFRKKTRFWESDIRQKDKKIIQLYAFDKSLLAGLVTFHSFNRRA